ncbi:MAG: dihydropteroate synthase [Eubacteriales bacterium]
MIIGKKEYDFNRHTHVMGILNVTPDSFSDGGCYNDVEKACIRVEEMIAQGADFIDIGAESTRPGHSVVEEAEELERLLPVIERIKREYEIPLSLDTYKGNVANYGIQAGVDLINDVWGLQHDEVMGTVIAQSGIPCVLMHNRKNGHYTDFMVDVTEDMRTLIHRAKETGIVKDQIILDVGIGFAKTYEQNLTILNRLGEFSQFGYPLLLGTSRKSVIYRTLQSVPTDCLEGTLATTVCAVMNRCGLVRVHDIAENVRTIRMAEAIREESGT